MCSYTGHLRIGQMKWTRYRQRMRSAATITPAVATTALAIIATTIHNVPQIQNQTPGHLVPVEYSQPRAVL